MPGRSKTLTSDHPIVVTFLILALIGFLWMAAEVLKPLALAILLSFALAPLSGFFERMRLPKALAVTLSVLLALGAVGGVGYTVGQQLTLLTRDVDRYETNIRNKVRRVRIPQQKTVSKLAKAGEEMSRTLEKPLGGTDGGKTVPVTVVSRPTIAQRLQSVVGPYLEGAGVGVFVVVLVMFFLANREDLSERLVRLGGRHRVGLTTRTIDEVGRRISRYLAMFATVNSTIGLIVALGLWAIGVPYPMVWGVLAALLRFFPYVGPLAAFTITMLFSVAHFPGWREPLMVLALFGVIETLAANFLEPIIYGKTAGVTALGLLVAALFWTWLWGTLGLLLSTPLTVCLTVLGKYVPGLGAFPTLLGEEPPLGPDIRLYQRLLALDHDGAVQIIETALKEQPRAEVFDAILVPVLSEAERDRARDDVDERQLAFLRRVIGDLLDELDETPEVDLETLTSRRAGLPAGPDDGRPLLGVAADDVADALALRMLAVLLRPWGCRLEVVANPGSPLQLVERLGELDPSLVVLSHLPPAGATQARYLVRRLRARFPDLPILVGRWGDAAEPGAAAETLRGVGASHVETRLADARDRILDRLSPRPEEADAPLPSPAPAAATGR